MHYMTYLSSDANHHYNYIFRLWVQVFSLVYLHVIVVL